MEVTEFRERALKMIDYICEYNDTLRQRRVTPDVEPGYMNSLIPDEAPKNPNSFDDIMKDIDTVIMPGMTHWQHPQFHAYFPVGTSYPCILAEMLIGTLNPNAFSWVASPACAELETIVIEMMASALGLPDAFISSKSGGKGGGVTQSGASECILMAMLGARTRAIARLKMQKPLADEGILLSKLIAYCSSEAHSCVEKAAKIALVKIRIIGTEDDGELNPKNLIQLMENDEAEGLIPFFVSTTIGTTASTAIDPIEDIAVALKGYPHVWLHVDGAYGGSALICPELRPLFKGIEHADSFNTNPQKWLLTSVECSLVYFRNVKYIESALVVDPLNIKQEHPEAIDYRNWSIALTRRFRALKLWFVLRCHGKSGLQHHIRNHIQLAKYFEELLRKDDRFEIFNNVRLGLVCFRVVGSELLNETLLRNINASGLLHMVPARVNGKYIIRFCIVAADLTTADIDLSWGVIQRFTTELWHKKDDLDDFLSRVDKRKLANMFSYFARTTSSPIKGESSIHVPFDNDDTVPHNLQDRRKSWITVPLPTITATSD